MHSVIPDHLWPILLLIAGPISDWRERMRTNNVKLITDLNYDDTFHNAVRALEIFSELAIKQIWVTIAVFSFDHLEGKGTNV